MFDIDEMISFFLCRKLDVKLNAWMERKSFNLLIFNMFDVFLSAKNL